MQVFSQAQSWDLQTPPVELSPSVHHCDLLRHMLVAFRSAALLFPQQSLPLLASDSFTTHSLPLMSPSALLHQPQHSSQLLAEPPSDPGCPPCSSGHYRGVTNWALSRETHELQGTQQWSSSSCVRGGHCTMQVNKKSCVNITHSNAVTDFQVK